VALIFIGIAFNFHHLLIRYCYDSNRLSTLNLFRQRTAILAKLPSIMIATPGRLLGLCGIVPASTRARMAGQVVSLYRHILWLSLFGVALIEMLSVSAKRTSWRTASAARVAVGEIRARGVAFRHSCAGFG
jgi:hypothetical protein